MAPALTSPTALRTTFPEGVASARQLVAAGVAERTVYHRCLEGGPWQRALPGIVFLFTGVPSRRQYVIAALLLGGPEAMVTGIEACRLHGLRRGPTRRTDPTVAEQVHLLVPHGRQLRSVGYVHVERTTNLPAPVLRRGLRITPVARACADAVRRLSRQGEITELLSDAVQRRLCTVSELVQEIAENSRRGTALPNRVLRDVSDGVRSAAEAAAKRLWHRAALPEAGWNVPIHAPGRGLVGIADCWVDDVAMVWEIESTEWHLDPAAHDHTVARAGLFTAVGAVYVASKPRRVLTDPREVTALLRAVHAQAVARPRPPLRAVPPSRLQ